MLYWSEKLLRGPQRIRTASILFSEKHWGATSVYSIMIRRSHTKSIQQDNLVQASNSTGISEQGYWTTSIRPVCGYMRTFDEVNGMLWVSQERDTRFIRAGIAEPNFLGIPLKSGLSESGACPLIVVSEKFRMACSRGSANNPVEGGRHALIAQHTGGDYCLPIEAHTRDALKDLSICHYVNAPGGMRKNTLWYV